MSSTKTTRYALILGGVFYLIANGILTPLMPQDIHWTQMFASNAFLARLSVAAAAVFFLLVGALGVYQRQSHKTGPFGAIAFALVFTGSMITFAHEWGQVFFLHELAKASPEGLQALEDIEGPNLYDIEALAALFSFTIGWLLFAISILLARVINFMGPLLLIIGFFAIPIFTASLPGLWGFIVGNLILAFGWISMGSAIVRSGGR